MSNSPTARRLSPRVATALLLAAVLLGLVCRVAQYLANQSYWADEAALVLNIREKPVPELLGRLDYAQAAPPLFLLIERGLFVTLGGGEMALRVLPFAAGMVALVIFALTARRVLPSPWDAAATLAFALGDRLIYHDIEIKPYAVDVAVCTLMLFLAIGPRSGWSPFRRLACLAAAAVVTVWLSFPSVIVFAALSLALMPGVVKSSRRGFVHYVLLNLPVVASFGGSFLLALHAAQQNTSLMEYWLDAYIDFRHPLTIPWWLIRHLNGLCDYALPATGPLVFVGCVFGITRLWTGGRDAPTQQEAQPHNRQLLWILAGPVAMALVPAALHRYPFDGARLTVYLTPCVILLTVIGFKAVADVLTPRIRQVALLPVIVFLAAAVYWCGLHLVVPRTRGHLRPIAAIVASQAQPTDTIYCLDRLAFLCYWPGDPSRVKETIDRADQIPTQRFWIIWPFAHEHGRIKPEPALKWARQFSHQDQLTYGTGGAAALFTREDGKLPANLEPPYGGVQDLKNKQQSHRVSDSD